MNRTHRVIALTMVAAVAVAACRKKPETAPPPANAPPPSETCDQRCRDSIATARAEAARRDSIARAEAAKAAAERARAAAVAALTAKVFFDYDRSDITPESRAALDAKLPVLRRNPGVRLLVAGNADERGSDAYNLALGQRRAASAKRYLTDNGIDPSRIEIVSYGEERPAVDGHDESAWRQNRRDEFQIIAGGDNIMPPE
jgi:peptidoglycan-associated lipoprotein